MKETMNRRTFLKKIVGSLFGVIATGFGGYYYGKYIEPFRLQINHIEIAHPLIPKGFNGCRLVQFSDTHLGFHYDLPQFKKHIQTINSLQPDVILFTGDLMDRPNQYPFTEQVVHSLQQLEATFGKFAIYGNHDHGGYGTEIYRQMMNQSGFVLLKNESYNLQILDGSSIEIIGIDDAMLGSPNITQAIHSLPQDRFKILLSHAPDVADQIVNFPIHLQISGHSHGGQVQIPYFGPLVTPPLAEKYLEGKYTIDGEHSLILYVNRGLGTTRLPFRLFSVPEITVFTLKSIAK
ncbi:metallophosphoesterase [Aeribacillus pallidus]|jgi:uncharacterized protein|uniref:metallophosphoesterase n=1 Tax=Aeribacillus pallidus TaxID=33936 RepID=UPI001DB96497|nr:metallophosphoesterase [Bacillus sp. (in: firmicutes)]